METKQFNCRLAIDLIKTIERIADEQASSQASVVTQAVRLLARRLENTGEMAPKKTSRNPK